MPPELLTVPTAICLTGGAGFIGSWLVRQLLLDGHTVTVLDDLSSGTKPPGELPGKLRFVKGSVTDARAVDDAAREAGLLIHLAGTVGMRQVKQDRQLAYAVSVEGTRMLLARTPGVPAVIASSSAVYGHHPAPVVHEALASRTQALDYDGGHLSYATGKWDMEELARADGRPVLCIRPFNVVGPGQVSSWGMVVPSFIERAQAGEPLQVYDDGLQTRSFSAVQVFIDTLLRAIRTPAAWQLPDGALNIGTVRATAIVDLARTVLARTGSASQIAYRPFAEVFPGVRDVRMRVPDTSRLQALLGPVDWPDITSVVDAVMARQR